MHGAWALAAVLSIGRRATRGPTKVGAAIDFGRSRSAHARPTLRHVSTEPDHPQRRRTRDWVVDTALFVLALLVGLVIYGEAEDVGLPDWFLFADLVSGVAGCCALWFRRRWPLGVAFLLMALTAFSQMASAAGLIALFSLALRRRFEVVALVAVVGILVTTPVYVAIYSEQQDVWIGVVLGILITVAVVAWGSFVRARRQLVLSLRDRAQRAEAEQQLRVEQERARIAREMHDVLAHRISLVSLHAGALEFRSDASSDEVARSAAVIRSSAHEALQDLREILGVLRAEVAPGEPAGDVAERPQPTLADIARLVEESRQAGVRVSLDCAVEELSVVPASIGRTAYRVVQEGLTNARKHAPGAEVVVVLSGGAGPGLGVEVRNRWPVGVPVTPGIPGAQQGLTGLAERTAISGGRLEHGRTPAGDFRLAAWLPWPA
jgi:signal transduction histidine kinase